MECEGENKKTKARGSDSKTYGVIALCVGEL